MVETLTQSGACIFKAGKNLSTDLTTGTVTDTTPAKDVWTELINQAEAEIAVATRRDWVADYSGLDANVKKILDKVASDIAGAYGISYDMSGFTSRVEAETMLDVLRDSALRGISILRDIKTQEFIDDPSASP